MRRRRIDDRVLVLGMHQVDLARAQGGGKALPGRRVDDPAASYVARLARQGRGTMARKLGEEAVEAVVAALEGDREAEPLVDAMIRLARALELQVIAEGVETESQRDQLVKCGCTEFQGFLVGRPMTLEQAAGLAGEGAKPPPRRFRRAG